MVRPWLMPGRLGTRCRGTVTRLQASFILITLTSRCHSAGGSGASTSVVFRQYCIAEIVIADGAGVGAAGVVVLVVGVVGSSSRRRRLGSSSSNTDGSSCSFCSCSRGNSSTWQQ